MEGPVRKGDAAYGYMAEYPIARACAEARVQTIYGGASEIMRTIIAREVTGLRA